MQACTPPNPHAHTQVVSVPMHPQRCTHMNRHGLTHTDTAAHFCPHMFCLPEVLVGAPRAATARRLPSRV